MPVSPTYPGVYVQEVPSGVRTIVGVATSIGMFIGASKRGPIANPRHCQNYTEFKTAFGEDASAGDLARYVKLFFLNGGTECYVMRIANGASASAVTLLNEAGTKNALVLTAKDEGAAGENIRAVVTYAGPQPEVTFNIDLFAWDIQGGQRVRTRQESWKNLTMNPNSSGYAVDFLTQNSKLVNASLPSANVAAPQAGFSQSGRPVPHAATVAAFKTAWSALIGGTSSHVVMSIEGSPFIDVDLNNPALVFPTTGTLPNAKTNVAGQIQQNIITQFAAKGILGIAPVVSFVAGPNSNVAAATTLLKIQSANGDILIRPASSGDLAVPLMLGSEQGGIEVGSYAPCRPAPNGITLNLSDPGTNLWLALANLQQNAITNITLDESQAPPATGTVPANVALNLVTTAAADFMYQDASSGSPNGNNDGIREKLNLIMNAINTKAGPDPLFRWAAQVAGTRLTILPTDNMDDNFLSTLFNVTGFAAANFLNNVKTYTLGGGGFGIGGRQATLTVGSDGGPPFASDYDNAYPIIDSDENVQQTGFNLMVLPPVANAAAPIESVYGNASVFCQQRRAFLLMDPPSSWTDPQTAAAGVTSLRTGLVKDYSAVFYPRVTINENGLKKNIGPAGAIAGLCGRIDVARGVWKAPAGTEADLRGIVGLESTLSDGENGTLNPRAINTIRVFPSGIVNWGARTNDGDDNTPSDWKYIPVRRLALFLEESLYRGLKWVVFEPNDEPLWAQIRLNVGAFMHDLFRQGAFQGATPKDAYFVKCDGETTTQNDRNLGRVNIWVGFAPLKPAEFVILYLQQMAGQIQT